MTDQATGSAEAGNQAQTPNDTASSALLTGNPPANLNQPAETTPAAKTDAWYGGFTDDGLRGLSEAKGWKSPEEAVKSYHNLEKMLGADRAGRTVVLPGENADQAERDAFYTKLGRPAEAKDYKIDVPEGAPPEFAEAARTKFHELGLTSQQAEALVKWNNEQAGAMAGASEAARLASYNNDQQALEQAWGAAYEQNLHQARGAVASLGVTADEVNAIQKAWGHRATMEFFQKIGSRSSESDFVAGSGVSTGALTPAAAKAEIARLRNDREWGAGYIRGDADKRARMSELNRMAFPEPRK